MKNNWEVKKLGEIVEFQRGLTYSKNDEVDYSSNIVLRATNINLKTNSLDFTELKYINENVKVPDIKKVAKGSLIVCTASGSKSHLGKVALIDSDYDYAFGGFMGQITPKANIDSRFLFYILTSDSYKEFIDSLSDGVNINNLKFDDLREYPIPLPPLPEQRRIVAILDEAFAAIAKAKENAEKNLQNAREIFESYLQGVFANPGEGWEEKKLGELFDIKHGFAFKSQYFANRGEYLLLTPGNFFEEGGYRDRGEKTKYYKGEIPKEYILKRSDLLIAMTEQAPGLLGSPIIVPESNKFLHNQRLGLIIYKKSDNLHTQFLFHLFNTKRIRNLIHRSASGVKVRHTSPSKVYEIIVLIPPLAEQHSIVVKLDALSIETKKLEALYQQKLNDLEELKKSILHKAFTGELTGKQA